MKAPGAIDRVEWRRGLFFWLAAAVAAVVLRGVRWDENYEFAQVILRSVPYPEGHPLFQYTRSMFSLQPHGLAAFMAAVPGELAPNLLRNVLMLWAGVLPAYLLGASLGGRAWAGHAAAALVLAGVHQSFYSNYPAHVWPHLYSNGPVGMGWALLGLWALVERRWRLAGLLVGLMPVVHLGQFPPLLGVAALRLPWLFWRENGKREAWAFLRWAGVGLAACLAFALVQQTLLSPPPPTEGPYAGTADAAAVYEGYMTHFATHRRPPWGTGHLALAGALLLGTAWAWREPKALPWLALYIALCAGAVWCIMALHVWWGAQTPRLFLAWMPYRLMNHAGPLFLVLSSALLARRTWGKWMLSGILIALAALPAAKLLLPHALFHNYLADASFAGFLLAGASAAAVLPWPGIAAAALVWLPLAWFHQFGAAMTLAGGGMAGLLAWRMHGQEPQFRAAHLLPGAAWGLLLASLLATQTMERSHLPRTDFEEAVRAYFGEREEPATMVLAPHQQEGLQARLEQPVMADMATITWVPYKPALGPSLEDIYRDCFGFSLMDPAYGGGKPWFEAWRKRSAAEWQGLGTEYGFRYVLAPAFLELPLRKCVAGQTANLWRIEG